VPDQLLEALVKLFMPVKVLLSVRRVDDADEPPPVALSVVPVRVRFVPIFSVFKGEVPFPIRIPERVVDPVPPLIGNVTAAFAT